MYYPKNLVKETAYKNEIPTIEFEFSFLDDDIAKHFDDAGLMLYSFGEPIKWQLARLMRAILTELKNKNNNTDCG